MPFYKFNYLVPKAKRLTTQWARNWKHPEKIPEICEALAEFRRVFAEPEADREKRLDCFREVGRRLELAFKTNDAYERDVFLVEARRLNAIACSSLGVDTASRPDVVVMAKGNPLDQLLYIVQTRLAKRMRKCLREECPQKYFFRDPGQNGQKYCRRIFRGQRCGEIVNNMGKLRYREEQRRKEPFKQQLERSGMPQEKITKLLNGETVRFDD